MDPVVMGMFAGVLLDTCTTWALAAQYPGFEQNPILAPLMRHSRIWIPIYLLSRPVLVPLLPDLCRFGFAVYFGISGLLFGLNNLFGLISGRYFLVDAFGYQGPQAVCMLIAIAVFVRAVWMRAGSPKEKTRHIVTGLSWIGIFVLLELGFFAAGRW